MCRFKSGIILKTRCVVAEGANDSHTDLLEKLNIEDTEANVMTKFVCAELLPPDDEWCTDGKWWTDPDTWEINVDQGILPDWYEEDQGKYNTEFRRAVKDWWKEHVLIDQKIDELSSGYYCLKECEVGKLLKDVQVMCDSSTVREMCDSSTVQRMCGGTVQVMRGSSTVQEMRGSSTVQEMHNSSAVQMMCDSSTVQVMCDSSTVQVMRGSSTVQRMCGGTVREMCDSSTVQVMCGSSTVQEMRGSSTVQVMRGSSTVQVMRGNSTVQEMYVSSEVQRMYNDSIARDYCHGKLYISGETKMEIVRKISMKEDDKYWLIRKEDAIKIVNQAAAEYNNGWIPVESGKVNTLISQ